MNDFIAMKVDLYCDLVKKGKPCACEAIQARYVEEIVNRVNKSLGIKIYVEEPTLEWKTIWIYKDDYMLEIIKSLPEEPKTSFEHWILGKAFGYSDEAIKTFLETKS